MTVSTSTLTALQRTDDAFGILQLLEITGDGISTPVRLVADTRDLIHQGQTYIGIPFELVLPKQADKEIPRASIRVDNVGRELTQELESLPPGAELTATIKVVHRKTPDVVDYAFTAPMSGVAVDVLSVSAAVGVTDLWRRPAVDLRYDPLTAPGLFPT